MSKKFKILLVFKEKKKVTPLHEFWFDKFKKGNEVIIFFINEFSNKTNKGIVNKINEIILKDKIDIVLFEGDHASIIDYDFVDKVNSGVKKGMFLGDNMEWHQVNMITGSACNFILPEDPISVLKFKEIGYESFFTPVEGNEDLFKDYKLKKDIDVLIFGRLKSDREMYLNMLKKNNINYKFVTPYLDESNTMEKLAKLINRSKITVALTKSNNGSRYFNPLSNFENFFQLKGRVFMTGLCNSLCISETCPSYDLIFPKNLIPTFQNKEELLKLLNNYLQNDNLLKEKTNSFYKETQRYADINYIKEINQFIEKCPKVKQPKPKIPIWYTYLFINQFLRLRFKNNLLLPFLLQSKEILFDRKSNDLRIYLFKIIFLVILFIRYFPLLSIKKISNIIK